MVDASNFRGRVDLNDHGSWQRSRVTGLRSPQRFLVYCSCQVAGDLDCQAGSRLAFTMISFSSLVALVISRSSAATA